MSLGLKQHASGSIFDRLSHWRIDVVAVVGQSAGFTHWFVLVARVAAADGGAELARGVAARDLASLTHGTASVRGRAGIGPLAGAGVERRAASRAAPS